MGVALACAGLLVAGTAPAAEPDAATLRRGEQIYTRCAACHAIDSNRTGPQHCGLFGRRAGTAPGFTGYSKAMRDSKIVWNANAIDHFLQDPMKAVPGTAMGYAGVKDPKERADLIAWLSVATRPGQGCTPRP
ncbi:MAG TPA: c-type cytochrome [Ramlibacter sp.]|nr:c-type cytochrome [Ramlibacter sp.]